MPVKKIYSAPKPLTHTTTTTTTTTTTLDTAATIRVSDLVCVTSLKSVKNVSLLVKTHRKQAMKHVLQMQSHCNITNRIEITEFTI